jgi:NTP pyrophosphatase (non-canonical NTP hydrolase)
MTPLDLAEFHIANQERAPFFPSACQGWILAQWGNALAGEVGEACNVIKKIDRGDFTLDEAREDLASELADAFTYLDHIASKAGIDLGAAVIRKFNVVSERRGLAHRMTVRSLSNMQSQSSGDGGSGGQNRFAENREGSRRVNRSTTSR